MPKFGCCTKGAESARCQCRGQAAIPIRAASDFGFAVIEHREKFRRRLWRLHPQPRFEAAAHAQQFRPRRIEELICEPVNARRQRSSERCRAIGGVPERLVIREQQIETGIVGRASLECLEENPRVGGLVQICRNQPTARRRAGPRHSADRGNW